VVPAGALGGLVQMSAAGGAVGSTVAGATDSGGAAVGDGLAAPPQAV